MKKLLLSLILLFLCGPAFADLNKAIQNMTEDTTPEGTGLLYEVKNPGTVFAVDRKLPISTLISTLITPSAGATALTGLSDVGSDTVTAGRVLVSDGTKFQSVGVSGGDVFLTSSGRVASNTFAKQLTGLSDIGSSTATAGNLLIGDGTKFQSKVASGSCTITSAGVFSCSGAAGATTLTGLSDVGSATITAGNLLVANGTKFQSVALSGGDMFITSSGRVASNTFAKQLTGLSDVGSSTVGAGRLLINDGTKFQSLSMSGNCAITSAGVITCSTAGGGATQLTGLSDVGSSTAGAGRLLINDGVKFQSKTMSGDATITSAGAITIAGAGLYSFRVHKSAGNQTITGGAEVDATFETEDFDVGGNFASSTFTAPVTAKYLFTAQVDVISTTGSSIWTLYLFKNAAVDIPLSTMTPSSSVHQFMGGAAIVALTAGDTVTLRPLRVSGSGDLAVKQDGTVASTFTGSKLP